MECSVGVHVAEVCHKLLYSRSSELKHIESYNNDEKYLLEIRTGLENKIETVCTYHERKFLHKFFHIFGKSCCDPFSVHKKSVKKSLREITLNLTKNHSTLKLIPGKAVCTKCLDMIQNPKVEDSDPEPDIFEDNQFEPNCVLIESVNNACLALGVSPVKVQKLSTDARTPILKNKVTKIAQSVTKKLSSSFELDLSEIQHEKGQTSFHHLGEEYSTIIDNLKEKIKTATTVQDKVNILSLLPKSWTYEKVQNEFKVSQYLARQSRLLVTKYGILPEIGGKRSSKKLNDLSLQTVQTFYENDDNSRLMPGKKDCVSIKGADGTKVNVQKRLILCNLKELFSSFKEKHPDIKIGFSKFAELRPKFCILAGASGTHSVCVCLIHQNVKLMLCAIKTKHSYRDLLNCMVCDVHNEACMFSICEICPGFNQLIEIIQKDLDEFEIDESQVKYKQWISTDRCELITVVIPFKEYLEKLSEKFQQLKSHHFISKKQAEYLNEKKETLSNDECIILADFSENFSFIIQDEVQSYHWVNSQATVHPFVAYLKCDGVTKSESYCVISDTLDHSTVSFYTFQKQIIQHLKVSHQDINKVIYFSDGSSAQYKNKKNFINLCNHEQDFGMKAEWHFFATSHGKGPCDGIGGTVKRIVTKASLQRTINDHIITPNDMYEFCRSNIRGITFFYCSEQDAEEMRNFLEPRFKNAIPIPKTRSLHSFIPTAINSIDIRHTSYSVNVNNVYITKDTAHFISVPKFNDYVCCIYDAKWWLGIVINSARNQEYKIKFFHPHGPGTSFKLTKDDIMWVNQENILKILSPLELTTVTGRTHNITTEMNEHLSRLLNQKC